MKQLSFKAIVGLVFVVLFSCAAQDALAQAAAVPSQFRTAHTAFFANAGAPSLGGHEKEAVAMAYTSLYNALAADKQYQLMASPTEAELAFEISMGNQVSSVTNGTSFDSPYLRLAVYDVKTHCLLWNIDEPIRGAFRAAAFQKNADEVSTKVVADLHSLASGKQP